MRIVINDANILIDLVKLDLQDEFFELGSEFHTTDFVINELNDTHQIPYLENNRAGNLNIIETKIIEDFEGIYELNSNNVGLSIEDCSVWYYSDKLSGILLTGDGKLRKQASKNGVEVRGIFFVFDELIVQKLLAFDYAIEKIQQLSEINKRLPMAEIIKRIELWKKGQGVL